MEIEEESLLRQMRHLHEPHILIPPKLRLNVALLNVYCLPLAFNHNVLYAVADERNFNVV